MHAREHVEDLIIASLSRQHPDDLPDSAIEAEFKRLIPVFEVVMEKVLRKTHIPAFTDEDLISFMLLKAHKLLRQQKYDPDKNPYSFFYVTFNNLMRDIIRRQNTLKAQNMRWDVIDIMENHRFGLDPERVAAFISLEQAFEIESVI